MKWLWNDFTIGIITGLITSFIPWCANKIYQFFLTGKSKFSGNWEQQIYRLGDNDYSGDVIKRDKYSLKHVRIKYTGKAVINITGTIQRLYPQSQNHRLWNFVGYLSNDIMTIIYDSAEGQISRGCIYLRLTHKDDGEDYFQGYYLEEHSPGVIDKVPVILRKSD